MEVEDADSETVVVVVAVEVVRTKIKLRLRGLINPSIRGPSTLTFRKESGVDAPCISALGARLIFVTNQGRARGRMCSRRSLKNEVLTSSEIVTNLALKY